MLATTLKSNTSKLVYSILHNRINPLWVVRNFSSSTHRTADPSLHSSDPEGIDADEAAKKEQEKKHIPTKESPAVLEGNQTIKPTTQTNKIESSGVHPPLDPFNQQKRHSSSSIEQKTVLEEVSCVGIDGSPLPNDETQNQEDNKEYYKDRKPSPLAEMEMAETRLPITRATDGGASSGYFGDDPDVIGWREEQLDTAEDSLRRATLIWKQNAMRDDPDSPQAKALRRAMIEQRAKLGLSEFDPPRV